MSMFSRDVAQYLQDSGVGVFTTPDPALRDIFVGQLPADVTEGLVVLDVPSPPPHQYVDMEYPVLDFWVRSPHTDRAHAKLDLVYQVLHRNYAWRTGGWYVHWSHALGSIQDVDRDLEGGKLLRLSIQFICRNLNHVS